MPCSERFLIVEESSELLEAADSQTAGSQTEHTLEAEAATSGLVRSRARAVTTTEVPPPLQGGGGGEWGREGSSQLRGRDEAAR